ncbi:hypothetical protein CDD83_2120 [Cordyceps sp. RAO-2017]|nr:hypothetical protein CDD83_2120 [Cordyceps sp. RAO-2017]
MRPFVVAVFDAIFDWRYILEWRSALSRDAKARISRRLLSAPDPESLRPDPAELARLLPSVVVQQQKILGQVPSDQTIEIIAWDIVEPYRSFAARMDAICFALRHSKQLVKSLLAAGDGWKLRIVNCPKREFRHTPRQQAKGNNRRVNAAKERQRQTMVQNQGIPPLAEHND